MEKYTKCYRMVWQHQGKNRHSFISFDIVDFYPSISENLLDQASWAFDLADIPDEDISVIKHGIKKITAICLMLPWVAI